MFPIKEHLEILLQGTEIWNQWRVNNSETIPSLNHADLKSVNLSGVNLDQAKLQGADLSGATLRGASFVGADLSDGFLGAALLMEADFTNANLMRARLFHANLKNATLRNANCSGTYFGSANLTGADLTGANLLSARLSRANVSLAKIGWTQFDNNYLCDIEGFDTLRHDGPSSIGIDTIYRSGGNIPEMFLRGAGVPDNFMTYMRSLVYQAIEFYSCFISYSTKDEEFARLLYSRLRDANIRTWFAPEDVKGGQRLHDQIERAIQVHDRLLVVLSEYGLQSEWVSSEIRNARQAEVREKRRKLFPIRLVDMETIRKWQCFDAESGKDLAAEVREYFIADFSNWRDSQAFEAAFARLLRDLRPTAGVGDRV